MQKILIWLGKYNISTHTLGIIAIALTAAFEGYKPFHDLVTGFYTGLPTPVQVLIGTGGFLYALYKTGALSATNEASTVKPAIPPAVVKMLIFGGMLLARYHRFLMMIAMVSGSLTLCMLLTGCGQLDWLNDIINIVPVLVAGATSIGALVAGLTGSSIAATVLADISAWQTKVEAGLKNIESLIAAYKATPGESTLEEIEAVAQLLVSDINSFDSIVGVPAALSSKIQSVAQLLLSMVESIISAIPVVKIAATASAATSPVVIPAFSLPVSSSMLKQQLNAALQAPTGHAEVDAAATTVKAL
jgi:hypothetical protein